ncbi:MAG: rRNA pseudouridine synthase [Planctomycetes bacterium]|nr:rRNA pseudouridine synthase [Planctomycetota bacterium]
MPLERLHKVLAHAGFGSRRACEKLIAAGEVSVDGKVVTQMGVKVDAERQKIKCADRYVKMPSRVVLLLNKPKGIVTTARDNLGRRTVLDLLGGVRQRVYPAGRLDVDSQGMLILTNDGDLCNRLTHPRFSVPRTYHAVLRGRLDDKIIDKLGRGVWLSEGKTGPVHVRVKKQERELSVVEVVVREGMNREVRRVFARFGLKVKHLKRVRIGRLDLGSLPEGRFRPLDGKDVDLLLADSNAQPAGLRTSRKDRRDRRASAEEE